MEDRDDYPSSTDGFMRFLKYHAFGATTAEWLQIFFILCYDAGVMEVCQIGSKTIRAFTTGTISYFNGNPSGSRSDVYHNDISIACPRILLYI
ncbi:MAG: hypothetical protein HQ517_00780 [SAR324 cluster bacterium]|nr:hypothetical protein [SAR324 cluster bacterium]